jgi:cytochrome P450
MTEVQAPAIPTDLEVDDVLNRFVYSLYVRARAEAAWNSTQPIISDPGQIEAMLRVPDRFRKNFSLVAALGHSRFSTNALEWEWRRDLTQGTYARAGAPGNRRVVTEAYAAAFSDCDCDPPQAIQRALLTASTRIFLLAFGRTAATDSLLVFFDRARRAVKRLQYHSWRATRAEELSYLRDEVRSLIDYFGQEMTRSPQLWDLLQDLQRSGAKIEGFGALDEFLMNFFAGIETTAATLSFAIDRLGIDERVQLRLLEEVDANECPYIECFLNETLRYFPAIPFVVREVAADTTIDGVTFRSGQLLTLSVVGAHHDPRYWKEPHIFDCSRAEFLSDSYDRRAFIPFLAGPRMCGGARLARMELAEGLKAFIRRFKVERDGDEIKFDYGLALRPNSWDRVRISRRR